MPHRLLFTGDFNIGVVAGTKTVMPSSFIGVGVPAALLGDSMTLPLTLSYLLMWLLPAPIYSNFIYAIMLVGGSLFVTTFLRLRGVGWAGCALAAITAFWLGSNLTLAYAGHLGKFGVLMFGAASLYLIEAAVQRRSLAWSLLAGGALGGMVLEQQDVALFFGLFLAGYACWALFRDEGLRLGVWFARLAPMGLVAFLLAGSSVVDIYGRAVKGVAITSDEVDPKTKWEFCTQWSIPPEEVIDLVAPGFTGWRSGEPAGPYWGRTGQSAGWSATRQGFRNFRLESIYIGAIPISLALLALVLALRPPASSRPRAAGISVNHPADSKSTAPGGPETATGAHGWRGDVIFWGSVAVVTLLLSFGKYFPLYWFFYHLPFVSTIRNPNKFIQVFQVAIGILAGFGLDRGLRAYSEEGRTSVARRILWFAGALLLVGVVLLFWASGLESSRGSREAGFISAGWGGAAAVIVDNMIRALTQGGVASLFCGLVLWLLSTTLARSRKVRFLLVGGLFVALIADLLSVSRYYIQAVKSESLVGSNIVTKYLQEHVGSQRIFMTHQSGFYNQWLTILFPYHFLPSFNLPAMPRLGSEYTQFLGTVGRNPFRLWQLSSIGYVLTPIQVWHDIQKDPTLAAGFDPVLEYGVYQRDGGGIGVAEASPTRPAQHVILKYNKAIPRYSLVGDWEVVQDKDACDRLAAAGFDAVHTTVVSPDTARTLPSSQKAINPGNLTVVETSWRHVKLRANASARSILLITQKFSPDWKAVVDGKPAEMLRCNYLCQGVYLEPGEHEILLLCRPSLRHLWVQGCGAILVLAAVVGLAVKSRTTTAP